jgi:hypothetical protein
MPALGHGEIDQAGTAIAAKWSASVAETSEK